MTVLRVEESVLGPVLRPPKMLSATAALAEFIPGIFAVCGVADKDCDGGRGAHGVASLSEATVAQN